MIHPKIKILSVDDNPKNNQIVEMILGDEYDVTTVESANECFSVMESLKPELILLDVMMDGVDGYQVAKRLKNDEVTSSIRIIMLSACSSFEDRIKGYESGADDYVTKPFDGDELLAKVKIHLSLKAKKELNQLKVNLAMLIAHETRTPINSILGNAEYLMNRGDLDDEAQNCIQDVVSASHELLTFSNHALMLINLDTQSKLNLSKVNIISILFDIVKNYQSVVEERHIDIQVRVEDGIDDVLIDTKLIKNAISLIVDHALKLSSNHSIIEIYISQLNHFVEIKVQDHGSGFCGENMSHFFEPFHVSDIYHHNSGSGLCMAIVKRIVQNHGGTVNVCETPGGGLTITMVLPQKTEA